MPPGYDWITVGRFGVLVVGEHRFLHVRNASGGYSRAESIPSDFKFPFPVRTYDSTAEAWRTAYWSALDG